METESYRKVAMAEYRKPKAICLCGHTGLGAGSAHETRSGTGRCTVEGCNCNHFVFTGWLEDFISYVNSKKPSIPGICEHPIYIQGPKYSACALPETHDGCCRAVPYSQGLSILTGIAGGYTQQMLNMGLSEMEIYIVGTLISSSATIGEASHTAELNFNKKLNLERLQMAVAMDPNLKGQLQMVEDLVEELRKAPASEKKRLLNDMLKTLRDAGIDVDITLR